MESAPALSIDGRSGSRHVVLLWRAVPWLLLLGLFALCAWLLIIPIEALFARIPINYDEGWNAIHAQRLMAGGPLYPAVASGITINYPPLSFYLVGGLGRLMGDYIFAGRIIALLSQAVVAVNVAFIARRIGATGVFSLFAALGFALFTQIYFADYIGMDDPQWFGHALQTSALVLLLRGATPLSAKRLAVVALLLLLGGLAKQSLVALPLAVTFWIAGSHRRLLPVWLGYCAAGVLFTLAATYAFYGRFFFDQVIANPRNFTTHTLLWMADHILPRLLPFALFALGGGVLARRDQQVQLVSIYAALAAVTGIVLMSAQGVIYNALFDFVIAIMPLASLLGRLLEDRLQPRPRAGVLSTLLLALPLLAAAPHARDLYKSEIDSLDRQPAWSEAIAALATAPGPVICKQLSLCYWAHRESAVEFFNFGQRATRDPALAETLAQRIRRGDFALIQEDNPIGDSMLPGLINGTVDKYYRIVTTSPTILRVPKTPVSATP